MDTESKAEILTVWMEGDEPQFSVQPIFTDPAVWGLFFADIARLLGQAYADSGRDAAATALRVRDAFLAEFDSRTV